MTDSCRQNKNLKGITMEIRTKPSNREEQDCYLYLAASLTDLIEAQEKMEKRIRLIPRGWWMIKACTGLLKKLLKGLRDTFEPEKRRQMQRTADRCRHKLVIGPQAVRDEEQYVLSEHDFGELIYAAIEKCVLCMGSPADCKGCPLGKVLDGVSFITRQNRAWWEVFEASKRVDIGEEPGYEENA